MKTILKYIILSLVLHASMANAAISWNDLQASNEEAVNGYILGIIDAFRGVLFCQDKGVSTPQLIAIAKKYINDHPEYWNLEAAVLIEKPINQLYPCTKETAISTLEDIKRVIKYKP